MKIKLNQKGQGIMEYIILTSLVGIICLVAVRQFGGNLDRGLKKVNKELKKELKIR